LSGYNLTFMAKGKLYIDQLDARMHTFLPIKNVPVPASGWIKAIRTAIGMSLQQLGSRLHITKQSMLEIEQREKDGTITLNSLRETATALDMQLVYGFVPKDGSLNALIDKKATAIATKIVMRTSNSMKLEDQENSEERIKQAIRDRTFEIKNELPKILWD